MEEAEQAVVEEAVDTFIIIKQLLNMTHGSVSLLETLVNLHWSH